jgi:actin-related protein 6
MKKRPSADVPEKTLVIDNGGFTIKAGLACAGEETPQLHQCRIIPNCVARSRDRHVYIGAQLENCKDFGEMAFRRPVEKGYLVNWESEKAIWEGSFFEKNAAVQVRDTYSYTTCR